METERMWKRLSSHFGHESTAAVQKPPRKVKEPTQNKSSDKDTKKQFEKWYC